MITCTEPVSALAEAGTMGDFGQELRRRRTVAGLTLRSLAERVAFDYSYLAQVERGVRPGSATLAYRCDQALDAHGRLIRLFTYRKLRQLVHEGPAPSRTINGPPTPRGLVLRG